MWDLFKNGSMFKAITLFLLATLWLATTNTTVLAAHGTLTKKRSPQVSAIVPDTVLIVDGYAAPGATVYILNENQIIGTTIANSNGYFEKYFNAFAQGLHNIKTFYSDVHGLQSDTITINHNVVVQNDNRLTFKLPTTIKIENTTVKAGEIVRIFGQTVPNAEVVIIVDNNNSFTVYSNSNGGWNFDLSTYNYAISRHKLVASVSSSFLGLHSPTSARTFEVTLALGGVQIDEDLKIPVIIFPENGHHTGVPTVNVQGDGPANTQIEIWRDNQLIGSVFTGPFGSWNFVSLLTPGEHDLAARSCRLDRCSNFSSVVKVTYTGIESICSSLKLALQEYRYYYIEESINLDIHHDGGFRPYELIIDWGDGGLERFSVDNSAGQTLHYVYPRKVGQYNAVATLSDNSGCTQTVYFSVQVDGISRYPTYIFWIIIVGTQVIGAYWYYHRRIRLQKQELDRLVEQESKHKV